MTIHKKLIDIMNSVEAIGKNNKNSAQGYNFRGIDDVMNELHGHFKKHGVYILPEVLNIKREERENKNGTLLIYTALKVRYHFTAEDGSTIFSVVAGEAMDSGDKSMNKAMSAALKYALLQMLLIPTEDAKDSETETHEIKSKSYQPETEMKWLSDAQFEKALKRVMAGEVKLVDDLKATFRIKKDYREQLEKAAEAHSMTV